MSRYLMNLRQTGQGSGETDSTEAIVAKQESIVFGIAGPCDDLESDDWDPMSIMSYNVEDSSSVQAQEIVEISRVSATGYFVWTQS